MMYIIIKDDSIYIILVVYYKYMLCYAAAYKLFFNIVREPTHTWS